jgi:hypothetical protein
VIAEASLKLILDYKSSFRSFIWIFLCRSDEPPKDGADETTAPVKEGAPGTALSPPVSEQWVWDQAEQTAQQTGAVGGRPWGMLALPVRNPV